MTDIDSPVAGLLEAVARVESLAEGARRRIRFWGWLAVLAGAGAWIAFLWDGISGSWRAALGWSPLLLVMLMPGLILLGFGRRVARLGELPDRVAEEVGGMVDEARAKVAAEVAGLKTAGTAGIRPLVSSLKGLREYGDEIRSLIKSVVGTLRLISPLYLLVVLGSILGAGLVLVALLIAILILVF
jgi:hypothetical protein